MYRMMKFQYYLIVLLFYSGLFIMPGFSSLIESNPVPEEYETIIPTEVDMKLRFVNVIFRHGDRTPDKRETYPNDPYKNDEFYPIGRGQLTNAGKERAYQLGQLLRERYNHFLGSTYYQPLIYARSTFIPRCKMTLQLVLAALFPPDKILKWNEMLLWQPIDMKYAFMNEDGLMMPFRFPAFEEILEKVLKSPEIIEKTTKYHDIMKNVSAYAGNNITNLYHLVTVYQTIYLQLSMKLKLSKEAHILYINKQLLEATRLAYDLFAYNEELIRLNGGVLLRKIIEDMNAVINGILQDRKINLFSGHDLNVAGILRALHIKDKIYSIPNFTSSIILELFEWKNKYFVKVLYYWGIPAKVETFLIPGCKVLCPYDRFLELTSTTIPNNEDQIGPLYLQEDMFIY